MQILFDKIGHTIKPFHLKEDGILLEGSLQKVGEHNVKLLGVITGEIDITCNRCGCQFLYPMDVDLKLTLTNQIEEDKADLDIIEFLDGMIDISFILNSEINVLKSEYHYCKNCENCDEIFEIEF